MSILIDCIDGLTAEDIIRRIAKTANGQPFYLQTFGGYWWGDNIVPLASSRFATDGTGYWFGVDYTVSYDVGNEWMVLTISAASQRLQSLANILTIGNTYHHKLRAKSPTMNTAILTGLAGVFYNNVTIISNPPLTTTWQTYEFIGDAIFLRAYICVSNETPGEAVHIDNILIVDVT